MRNGKVVAIIPVRFGSVRVKNKSTRNFHNTNLLEHKIKQLLNIKEIDKIILTTDSDEAKKISMSSKMKYISDKCIKQEYQKLFEKSNPVFPVLRN